MLYLFGCALDWLERLELSNELCGPGLLKNGGFFLQLGSVCVCVSNIAIKKIVAAAVGDKFSSAQQKSSQQ